jgi:hypothetical protein
MDKTTDVDLEILRKYWRQRFMSEFTNRGATGKLKKTALGNEMTEGSYWAPHTSPQDAILLIEEILEAQRKEIVDELLNAITYKYLVGGKQTAQLIKREYLTSKQESEVQSE